ncbi:hypothetical protein BDC45DRAFT_542162 [Circinella umbellata]|nr:hypothetical protein BDC45DRAFT_542162 [Circinella umbellata]
MSWLPFTKSLKTHFKNYVQRARTEAQFKDEIVSTPKNTRNTGMEWRLIWRVKKQKQQKQDRTTKLVKRLLKRPYDQSSYQEQVINKRRKQFTSKETLSTEEIAEESEDPLYGEMEKNVNQEQAAQWIQKLQSLSDENKLLFIYEKL